MNNTNFSEEEKKRALFEKQKNLLDTFLEHHTITASQYEKSLSALAEKLGISYEKQQ